MASAESFFDPRTGLHNAAFLEDALPREVARAKRYGSALTLVLLDLNGLKQVNDQHGHAAGNTVLAGVAQVLKQNLRAGDIACRFGGDEFALVLAGAALDQAEAVCARLLDHVRIGQQPPVTFSAGMAELDRDEDWHSLTSRADAALFEAKRQPGQIARAAPYTPVPSNHSKAQASVAPARITLLKPRGPVRWEYLVEPDDLTPERLNDLGAQGWELTAAANGRLIFKRQRNDDPPDEPAGVREPRRPKPPTGSGSITTGTPPEARDDPTA